MTDADALLAAILASPGDDTARLVYADCIEERGQRERAEFVRVQVELEKTPHWMPFECKVCAASPNEDGEINHGKGCYMLSEDGGGSECAEENPRWAELRYRETRVLFVDGKLRNHRDWFPEFGEEWMFKLGTFKGDCGSPAAFVSRGFVSHVSCSWPDWSRHSAAILSQQPVERVTLAGKNPEVRDHSGERVFQWVKLGGQPSCLPKQVFNRLPHKHARYIRETVHHYESAELALAALSDACIAWGREQIQRPIYEHLRRDNP